VEVDEMKARKAKEKPIDHDLETWATLGGGILEPERELTEGQRIIQEANEALLELLQATATRPPNPFQRNR
jgi:hypothetical protein